jgi:hypothetical protein
LTGITLPEQTTTQKQEKKEYDPTANLPATDAWAMGRDFIDLSLGKAPKKPEAPKEKSVYITQSSMGSGFVPMAG